MDIDSYKKIWYVYSRGENTLDTIQIYNGNLKLATGWLGLDFVNTAEWHASDQPHELLNSYADLIAWAKKIGLLTEQESERLLQKATNHSNEAAAILEQAIDLREAIYRIFSATDAGHSPDENDLAILNSALQETLPHLQIVESEDSFAWAWRGDKEALDKMLWPIARSAADLLTSESLARIKVCEDDRGCGYVFLDLSKNQSRRWCDMRGCGNRAKVRRHRRRQRTAKKK